MGQLPWQKAMNSLSERGKIFVICRLLGRSGISDEEFIEMCEEYAGE